MVKSGQVRARQIRPIEFASGLHPNLPVEVLERRELLARLPAAHLATPERPSFQSVMLMHSAGGSHLVDFDEIEARPGRLVHIRPGQVHGWVLDSDFDASTVIAQPTASTTAPWFPGHRSWCDLSEPDHRTALGLLDILRDHQNRFDDDEPTSRLLVSVFGALVALFDCSATEAETASLPEPYLAFRSAVEADLSHRHDVGDYAARLGWSARTISRACQQVTGRTAKGVLTDRLVLEAKRLLVHTDLTAAAIGHQLGFSEATNFTKFFTRYVGTSPSDFRRS